MSTTLVNALQACAWIVARDATDDNSDNAGLALAVAARLFNAEVITLEQLDALLAQAHDVKTLPDDHAEPAPDDDAARNRMERSKHIYPFTVYVDPDGTRWEVVWGGTKEIAHKGPHMWGNTTRDDNDRETRSCLGCGLRMVKARMQT